MAETTALTDIRLAVRQLCAKFGESYWLALDKDRGYPTEFVQALTESGFLTVLIPEAYGGLDMGFVSTMLVNQFKKMHVVICIPCEHIFMLSAWHDLYRCVRTEIVNDYDEISVVNTMQDIQSHPDEILDKLTTLCFGG